MRFYIILHCYGPSFSPLAIPLIKPQPGDLSLSPREKALRSSAKVVPVVNSHNSPRDRAAASAVSAGSTVATSGVSPRVPAKGSPRSPQKGVSLNRIMAGDGAQNGGTSKRAGAIQESRSVPEPPTGATSALPAVFSPSSSPAKDPASEKSKKKNVLKALNEKSNPDSPRGTAGGTDAATDTGLSTGWSAGTVLPVGGDRLQLLAQLDEVQRSLAQTFTKASIDAALAHTKSN